MTRLIVDGGRPLRGRLRVPGDKSISHRALLLAALAEGTSVVRGLSDGDDVARTRAAVEAMGAVVDGDRITGGRSCLHEPADVIDVGNSGTSIRLLAGVVARLDWLTVLTGDGSIRRRPMGRVADPLRSMGAQVDGRRGGDVPPLVIRGGELKGIDYELPVASAQVKGAVLLAGLAAEGETVVRERTRTRAHTEEMLDLAGADVSVEDGGLTTRVRPSSLQPFELDVPGDPSQAAFWVVAACLVPGSDVVVENVYLGPARAGFVDVLVRMGADIEVGPRDIRARYRDRLLATTIGADEVPGLVDEIPVLAVAAALADGVTRFDGVGELRLKESDRLAAVVSMVGAASVEDDCLVVEGRPAVALADADADAVDSGGDHRMAMAQAVAALTRDGATTIEGWEAVATSYPGFEADMERLCRS
jgi:3-phosphoshikimate 1-carboxyvinyltransferase